MKTIISGTDLIPEDFLYNGKNNFIRYLKMQVKK